VGDQQIVRYWCGMEAQSIDDIPFIGQIPGLSGLTIAVGFSGHGFALAPAIGHCVADQINGLLTPELVELNPTRIAEFSSESIEAFISEAMADDTLE
jgi:glycine/D-amino acid oxidase-like deaminating enzyme